MAHGYCVPPQLIMRARCRASPLLHEGLAPAVRGVTESAGTEGGLRAGRIVSSPNLTTVNASALSSTLSSVTRR